MRPERIERVPERNEVAGYQPGALMDQLIERMLTVGSRLAPINRPGRIGHLLPLERDMLSVALHSQLLQICGKALQVLLVRQYGNSLRAEEVVVPDGKKTHQHRQVAIEGSGPK